MFFDPADPAGGNRRRPPPAENLRNGRNRTVPL